MSNQDNFQSNNPWHTEQSQGAPPEIQQNQQGGQQYGGYAAPPGPPPRQQQPGQPPRRSDTFKESDFVPESQRGEQREAMQQFEMNKSGNESQQDRDVQELQREFPGVDGSLIAALYSDSGNMGATREMLQELASQTQGS